MGGWSPGCAGLGWTLNGLARPRRGTGPGVTLQNPRPLLTPLRSSRLRSGLGEKTALLCLEAISHCVFSGVAGFGALSGRSGVRREKAVVPSAPSPPPLSFPRVFQK